VTAPLIERILAPGGLRALLQPVYRISGDVRAVHALECLDPRRIIAEGIETEAELDLVRSLGVELMQGWLFCKALPATDLALREPGAFRSAQVPAA
jgi:predicted signal transduction protein with EAL and GGDEF domain